MRDFNSFMEKHRQEMYDVAYKNCKHDEEGHCLLPKDDPCMKDEAWDEDARPTHQQEVRYLAAN